MFRDARYAIRMLWKHRAFTGLATPALAVAMTATVAIVTLASAVLVRPLPYLNAQDLFRVYGQSGDGRLSGLYASVPRFERCRDRQRSFSPARRASRIDPLVDLRSE